MDTGGDYPDYDDDDDSLTGLDYFYIVGGVILFLLLIASLYWCKYKCQQQMEEAYINEQQQILNQARQRTRQQTIHVLSAEAQYGAIVIDGRQSQASQNSNHQPRVARNTNPAQNTNNASNTKPANARPESNQNRASSQPYPQYGSVAISGRQSQISQNCNRQSRISRSSNPARSTNPARNTNPANVRPRPNQNQANHHGQPCASAAQNSRALVNKPILY